LKKSLVVLSVLILVLAAPMNVFAGGGSDSSEDGYEIATVVKITGSRGSIAWKLA
jgi:hypothetical protein